MRKIYDSKLSRYRVTSGFYASDDSSEYRGKFFIPYKFNPSKPKMTVLSSGPKKDKDIDDPLLNWEHVSISYPSRCPTWAEMCFIKNIFWSEEETVLQYHPAKKYYMNLHEYCLHLWKPVHFEVILPPCSTIA